MPGSSSSHPCHQPDRSKSQALYSNKGCRQGVDDAPELLYVVDGARAAFTAQRLPDEAGRVDTCPVQEREGQGTCGKCKQVMYCKGMFKWQYGTSSLMNRLCEVSPMILAFMFGFYAGRRASVMVTVSAVSYTLEILRI